TTERSEGGRRSAATAGPQGRGQLAGRAILVPQPYRPAVRRVFVFTATKTKAHQPLVLSSRHGCPFQAARYIAIIGRSAKSNGTCSGRARQRTDNRPGLVSFTADHGFPETHGLVARQAVP